VQISDNKKYKKMINLNKLEGILGLNNNTFLAWDSIFNEYKNELSDVLEHEKKIKENLFWDTFTIFSDILKFFTEIGRHRDEWTEPIYRAQCNGMNAHITSKKTGSEYSFGYCDGRYFLGSSIFGTDKINRLSDEFWLNMLTLNKYGKLDFKENYLDTVFNGVDIEKKYPTKSNLFKMLRDYLFFDFNESLLIDFGQLEVTWEEKIYWDDLIRNGAYAFDLLYKINYEIWKNNKKYSTQ
jgi:hypothetical protein